MLKKLFNNSFIYFFASIFVNASNILLLPIYTKYLQPSDYGIITSVTIFSSIITTFIGLGLHSTINRFYFDTNYEKNFKQFLFSNAFFQITFSLIIVLIIYFNDGLFFKYFFKNIPYNPFLKYGLFIGFFSVFQTIPLSHLHALGNAFKYRLFTISSFLLTTMFMFYFVVFNNYGIIGALKSQTLSVLIIATFSVIYIVKNSTFKINFKYIKTGLIYGLPLMVYTIFGLINDISSKYFIERFLNLESLGIFNLSQQISSIPLVLLSAINLAWLPIFYSEAQKSVYTIIFHQFSNFLFSGMAIISLFISMFSIDIISLISSQKFHSASIYIPILVYGMIFFNSYWILFSNALSFTKKTMYMPLVTFATLLISIPCSILLIPTFGLFGACITILSSNFILNFITFIIFKKNTSFKYDYRNMNLSFLISICIYLLSTLIQFDNHYQTIGLKFGFFIFFIIILHLLKIMDLKILVKLIKTK